MKRKVFALLMSVLLIGAMVVGCGSKNSTDSKDTSGDASSDASQSGDLITIGFSQVGAESDWRVANTESMKSALSEENGFKLIFADAQ